MSFIYKAVNDGWAISKRGDKYVFSKPHEGRKEIFENDYLESFIKSNMAFISK